MKRKWVIDGIVLCAMLAAVCWTALNVKIESEPPIFVETKVKDPEPVPPHNGVPGLLVDTSDAKLIYSATTPDFRVRRLPPVR